MKGSTWAVVIAAAWLPGASHAAEQQRVLRPTSAWTLDFADERCSLIRDFADGDDKLRLQIDAFGPTRRGYRVMVSGDLVPPPFNVPIVQMRVGYSPDKGKREQFYADAGNSGGLRSASYRQGFVPDPPPAGPADQVDRQLGEFERSIGDTTVQFGVRTPLRLETGNMAAPFAEMRRCIDDLVASWGVDMAAQRSLSRPAQLLEPSEGWKKIAPAPESDHPGYAERRSRKQAEIVSRRGELIPVRIMLDGAGKPTTCVVQVAFPSEAYRRSICQVLAANRYQPALDAQGRPVASFIQFDTR